MITKPISNFSQNFYDKLAREGTNLPVRQTVLSGPVDVLGRADFLQVGTGLEAISKDIGTLNPLVITLGNGFSSFGQSDITKKIDTAFSFDLSALDDEPEVFLYLELDAEGNVSTGASILEPVYSEARPASPATGQFFYPTNHRSRGEVFDGANWVAVNRIYVGECVTSAGVVSGVVSYAYGIGRGNEAPLGSGQKWVAVTSDRGFDTLYTNDTGRSISISITLSGTGENVHSIYIDGYIIGRVKRESVGINNRDFCIFTVPNGSTYEVGSGSLALSMWAELR